MTMFQLQIFLELPLNVQRLPFQLAREVIVNLIAEKTNVAKM